jgi:hypothetical protein
LVFKHTALKNIGFKYKESSLIVQALQALGEAHVDDAVKEKLRHFLAPGLCAKILKDTQTSNAWIYEFIKQICKEVKTNA